MEHGSKESYISTNLESGSLLMLEGNLLFLCMHTIILSTSVGAFLLKLTPLALLFIIVLLIVFTVALIRYVFKIDKISNDLSEMVRLLKKMNGEDETKDADNQ